MSFFFFFKFQVQEDAQIGTKFGRISIMNTDAFLNESIEYILLPGWLPSPFDIHSNTGTLFITEALDNDYNTVHHMSVIANAHDKNMNAVLLVDVHVENVNKFEPQCLGGEGYLQRFTASSKSQKGKIIGDHRSNYLM